MWRWLSVCTLLLVLSTWPRVAVSDNGGFRLQAGYVLRTGYSTGVVSSWENNSAFFIGASHGIGGQFEIAPRLTFRTADFREYEGDSYCYPPETHQGAFHGSALRAVEVATAVQVAGGGRLRFTAGMSVGAVVAAVGRVTREMWDEANPAHRWDDLMPQTGVTTVRPVVGMGMGVVFPGDGLFGAGLSGEFCLVPQRHQSGYQFWRQLSLFLEMRCPWSWHARGRT
jgi:hypothetical protein